ncbi:helix-turn-helix domain-containing protein [Pseudodesulfovibrio alkaliphilus]|nr:AraC family transcriptional regulator [Pseudodesulfovibrio alkaliphilus]
MSKLDIPATLHAQPEDFTFEHGMVTGNGFLFDPLPGFHFGACGPVYINAPIDGDFLYDTQLTIALLVLEGSCTIELDQSTSHHLQNSMFLIGRWNNQAGKVSVKSNQTYCHAAFMLEEKALEAVFGLRSAKDIVKTLEKAAGQRRGGAHSVSGIAGPDTILAARNVLAMQRIDGLDILRLRGACIGLFSKLIKTISASSTAYYPIPNDDKILLEKLKKRIENDFLNIGPASVICAEYHMSFSKANNAFKHLYSTTIAKYIQQCKLKHAYTLLHSRKMNVSECAFEIGYSNVSHFILAFKKQYGITPKKLTHLQDEAGITI